MTRLQKTLFGFAAFVFLLHVVGAFRFSALGWATHFYFFLPRPLLYGFGGLALLALLPPTGPLLARALDPLARALEGRSARIVAGLVIALAAVAFWLARQRIFLLHDERLLIESLRQGFVGSASKAFGGFVQLYTREFLIRFLHVTSDTASFRLLSIASGVAWLGAGFALVGGQTRLGWQRLTLGGLLLLCGMTRMFYGYAENTPLLAAAVALYVWAAARLLRTGRGWLLVVPAALLAAAMHVTGFLIVPSLFYLTIVTAPKGSSRLRWVGIALSVAGVGLMTLALGADVSPDNIVSRYKIYFQQFLPLVGPINAKQPYTLFSPSRWLDLFNEQLLLGPVALLALPLVALAVRRAPWRGTPLRGFLGWLILPSFLLAIFFNRLLGAFRDWDLLAFVALPATLLAGLSLIEPPAEPETPPAPVRGRRSGPAIDPLPGVAVALLSDRPRLRAAVDDLADFSAAARPRLPRRRRHPGRGGAVAGRLRNGLSGVLRPGATLAVAPPGPLRRPALTGLPRSP